MCIGNSFAYINVYVNIHGKPFFPNTNKNGEKYPFALTSEFRFILIFIFIFLVYYKIFIDKQGKI